MCAKNIFNGMKMVNEGKRSVTAVTPTFPSSYCSKMPSGMTSINHHMTFSKFEIQLVEVTLTLIPFLVKNKIQ